MHLLSFILHGGMYFLPLLHSVLVVAVQSAFKAAYRFCASTLKPASKSVVFSLICVAAVRPALLADIFRFCNDTFPVTRQPFMDGKVTPHLWNKLSSKGEPSKCSIIVNGRGGLWLLELDHSFRHKLQSPPLLS